MIRFQPVCEVSKAKFYIWFRVSLKQSLDLLAISRTICNFCPLSVSAILKYLVALAMNNENNAHTILVQNGSGYRPKVHVYSSNKLKKSENFSLYRSMVGNGTNQLSDLERFPP